MYISRICTNKITFIRGEREFNVISLTLGSHFHAILLKKRRLIKLSRQIAKVRQLQKHAKKRKRKRKYKECLYNMKKKVTRRCYRGKIFEISQMKSKV